MAAGVRRWRGRGGARPRTPHRGRPAGPGAMPAAGPTGRAGHDGPEEMGHDMSDPRMARAMEADMRNRFFVALALTIPTLLFSPLAISMFHLRLVDQGTANWIMLLLSTPVVWWAGW